MLIKYKYTVSIGHQSSGFDPLLWCPCAAVPAEQLHTFSSIKLGRLKKFVVFSSCYERLFVKAWPYVKQLWYIRTVWSCTCRTASYLFKYQIIAIFRKDGLEKLGQCRARPFKFHLVCLFFIFFMFQCSNRLPSTRKLIIYHALLYDLQRFTARVHWPPMKKFVCKLHGYIVYLFVRSWHYVKRYTAKFVQQHLQNSFTLYFINFNSRHSIINIPFK